MGADVLVTLGATASATMVLTLLNQDNSVSACEELMFLQMESAPKGLTLQVMTRGGGY